MPLSYCKIMFAWRKSVGMHHVEFLGGFIDFQYHWLCHPGGEIIWAKYGWNTFVRFCSFIPGQMSIEDFCSSLRCLHLMGFFYVPMFNIYMKLLSEVFWRFKLKIISELMTTSQFLLFVISGNTESEHGHTNGLMMANKLSFNQDRGALSGWSIYQCRTIVLPR